MLSFKKKSLRSVWEVNVAREGATFRVSTPATFPNVLSPLPENINALGIPDSRPDPNRGRDDRPKERV